MSLRKSQLISILKKSVNFCIKEAVNFVREYLHLLTNQHICANFKISRYFTDNNI